MSMPRAALSTRRAAPADQGSASCCRRGHIVNGNRKLTRTRLAGDTHRPMSPTGHIGHRSRANGASSGGMPSAIMGRSSGLSCSRTRSGAPSAAPARAPADEVMTTGAHLLHCAATRIAGRTSESSSRPASGRLSRLRHERHLGAPAAARGNGAPGKTFGGRCGPGAQSGGPGQASEYSTLCASSSS